MTAPPRSAELLLAALGAHPELRDGVLGDLAEEFAERVGRDGVGAARRWYYRESLRTAPHLLGDWWRAGGLRELSYLAGVVGSSYVFVMMIGLVAAIIVRSLLPMLGGSPGLEPLPVDNPLVGASSLALGFIGTLIGGSIAASLGRRAPLLSALALGVSWSCLAIGTHLVAPGDIPLWYRLAVPAVVLIGTTTGGVLRVRAAA